MKKRTILYIVAGIAVVILVLILTKQFPPVSGEEVGGTIGKVDRYRKVQMTEKDVILRNEFASDTSKLANSIKGLMFFNAVIKQYSSDLLVCAEHLKINEPSFRNTKALLDYTKFINKNVSSVENTIALLTDFYSGDTSDYSIDVENRLKEFNNFYTQLLQKDSVVSRTLNEIENSVSMGIVNTPEKKEGIRVLKNVHDQMLIKNVQLNVTLGNTIQPGIGNKILYNVNNLGIVITNKINLQGIVIPGNKVNLGIRVSNKENLGIEEPLAKENLGIVIPQNKENLQGGPTILNKQQLNSLISLGFFFNKTLSVSEHNTTLGNQKLNTILNVEKLNALIASTHNLGMAANSILQVQPGIGAIASKPLAVFSMGNHALNNSSLQQAVASYLSNQTLNYVANSALTGIVVPQ